MYNSRDSTLKTIFFSPTMGPMWEQNYKTTNIALILSI